MSEEDEPTYSIRRFYAPDQNKETEVVREGLTLQEAMEHCDDPDTEVAGVYFEGFCQE